MDVIELDGFDFDSLKIYKPKKCKETMVCKIKNNNKDPVIVQFPKMVLVSEPSKNIELGFTERNGYTSKVMDFLESFDKFLIGYISKNSEKWFGKNIPIENIESMYNKTGSTIHFSNYSEFIDKSIAKGIIVECISQLKYLVFTKDSCFINWEMCTARTKVNRVRKFGFIEDPEDNSDSEIDENITFF